MFETTTHSFSLPANIVSTLLDNATVTLASWPGNTPVHKGEQVSLLGISGSVLATIWGFEGSPESPRNVVLDYIGRR